VSAENVRQLDPEAQELFDQLPARLQRRIREKLDMAAAARRRNARFRKRRDKKRQQKSSRARNR
jgi:hypothetical protein